MRRKAAGEKRCWCGRARYTLEWRKRCVLMAKNHNSRVIVLHWNHILSFCREISHCDSHDSTVSASSISTRCCTFLCYFVSISAKSVIRAHIHRWKGLRACIYVKREKERVRYQEIPTQTLASGAISFLHSENSECWKSDWDNACAHIFKDTEHILSGKWAIILICSSCVYSLTDSPINKTVRAPMAHMSAWIMLKLFYMRWNPAKRIQNPSYDTKGATVGTWLLARIEFNASQVKTLRIMHIISCRHLKASGYWSRMFTCTILLNSLYKMLQRGGSVFHFLSRQTKQKIQTTNLNNLIGS